MRPSLVVTTGHGVERVVVQYDAGDQRAAFELFRQTLPALQDLDRAVRTAPAASDGARDRERARA